MPTATRITKSILQKLYRPPAKSHKGDNGRVLIIAGSEKYHGSLILAATMAAKIVDLVFLATTKSNFRVMQKYKEKFAEFIYIPPAEIARTITKADSVLIGPGMLPDKDTSRVLNGLLKCFPKTKTVLDAAAFHAAKLPLLHQNCILTPHAGEFKALFKLPATVENLEKMSRKYPSIIVLKGPIDYVAQTGKLYFNKTGNAGMTKGGTGDVLAGLIAALVAKNNPLLAAKAGVYLNGLAGDELKKAVGTYYSASELISVIQKSLKYVTN